MFSFSLCSAFGTDSSEMQIYTLDTLKGPLLRNRNRHVKCLSFHGLKVSLSLSLFVCLWSAKYSNSLHSVFLYCRSQSLPLHSVTAHWPSTKQRCDCRRPRTTAFKQATATGSKRTNQSIETELINCCLTLSTLSQSLSNRHTHSTVGNCSNVHMFLSSLSLFNAFSVLFFVGFCCYIYFTRFDLSSPKAPDTPYDAHLYGVQRICQIFVIV